MSMDINEPIDAVKSLDEETRYNTDLFHGYLQENQAHLFAKIAEQRAETPALPSLMAVAASMAANPQHFAAYLRRTFIDQGMEEEDDYDDDDALDDACAGLAMALGYMIAASGFLHAFEARPKESNLPAPNADGIVIFAEHSPEAFFIQQEERARLN